MSMVKQYIALSEEKLEELKKNPHKISDFIWKESKEEDKLDIDKAWHGIHYILTGDVEESDSNYNNIVFGGKSIAQNIGYGPAQYLTAKEVKENAKLLQVFSTEDFKHKFYKVKNEIIEKRIYPFIEKCDVEDLEYLLIYYEELQDFFSIAAEKDLAILHALI